jgi:hypothetical protein
MQIDDVLDGIHNARLTGTPLDLTMFKPLLFVFYESIFKLSLSKIWYGFH